MKITLGIVCFILAASFSNAQWQKLGDGLYGDGRVLYYDSSANLLYAGGNFRYSGSLRLNGIGTWNGQNWDSLGHGDSGNPVLAITKFQGKIYASGDFLFYPQNSPAFTTWLSSWNGTNWDSLEYRIDGWIGKLTVINNEMYIGGAFSEIGPLNISLLAKYDGSNYYSFPVNCPPVGYAVNDIEFFQNQMYIGGNFIDTLNQINDLARWNGNNFEIFGGPGIGSGFNWLSDLEVYNGELYIGGRFNTSSGYPSNNIMKWDGSQFLPVGSGLNAEVIRMHVFNNSLFVSGKFTSAGNLPVSGIAQWNGVQWDSVCPYFFNTGICDFVIINNDLYLTGHFDMIDSIQVNNIAMYHNYVGIDDRQVKNLISVFPNPSRDKLILSCDHLEKCNFEIYDITGRKFISDKVYPGENVINISLLNSGIYFLTADTKNGRIVNKFVKE